MAMAMKGWRRIGIVLSVIWFLGFGVYLWAQPTFDAQLLDRRHHYCALSYVSAKENEECMKKASLQYERCSFSA